MDTDQSLKIDSHTKYYRGKVRDVYTKGDKIFIVVSDRISAFDVILPKPIPYKGAVLNGISSFFLKETSNIIPNWLIDSPNSHFCYGHLAPTIPLEVIVRGYISGSMWRAYVEGERNFCGNILPEGLKNNQQLEHPIITPTTKASEGHDENISEAEILAQGILSKEDWDTMKSYAFKLFEFGSQYAASKNLILVDTKFEFGRKKDGQIILIDEILTPDSSRYFILSSYETSFLKGEMPEQLSKEFVRQWLIENNFMGREGDVMPEMTDEWIETISNRYIHLYTHLLGTSFDRESNAFDMDQIQKIYDRVSSM
jgi:phosphoribosylaminoimidazole-succinocarboxamide synthase